MVFKLYSKLKPTGDQPQAVAKLTKNVLKGKKYQTLLGVTGSGKTFSLAYVIAKVQKPVLIISHNKVLAAQLFQEFREFFPKNKVHYFVSYYDYYQPEAYIPQTDLYIEKDANINEEIDRLRHSATQSILSGKDVIIVASVSCIYGLGSPEEYEKISYQIESGQILKRQEFLKVLTELQYARNDFEFSRGTFRARGNTVEINSIAGNEIVKIEFWKDKIERISKARKLNSPFSVLHSPLRIYPAKHFITPKVRLNLALRNIKTELNEKVKWFKKRKKLLEAQRIKERTNYDLEMLEETGYCHGIENYSRQLSFRHPGEPPFTLIDYFLYAYNNDFLVIIDESHVTLPQLKGMFQGDRSRKKTLIRYGFRLPSALDNRPLQFHEFIKKVPQLIFASATPGPYELKHSSLVEQLIRPTGLLDPEIKIHPTEKQLEDLTREIKERIKRKERVLVTTLTKRLAEDLAEYLNEAGIKTHWLHSETSTLERPALLKDLRLGKVDVLVGINLLREGLDLPEVSLVAILDADKEGFLRNDTTLIQTMGRAARHKNGTVIMYADSLTQSMRRAIKETERRRKIQEQYNKKHRIKPRSIIKEIREDLIKKEESEEFALFPLKNKKDPLWLESIIKDLRAEMELSSRSLDFEKAARIRDEIKKLKTQKE